ncbi:kinase-like protein [Microstroma glucosiphilum]|uniref:non-specific serine/threonine protein kinase n=1 Tax=Pseudomicrostroma glucosiphilum TaxID=1684307 RepID=A0A316U7N7_9BASI|nr:kinase-like protein [Pseudomicrostroma glucosiphilum]PWN21249.1 kinase-like protein [Pseudomicrostroma glucosiphilum]
MADNPFASLLTANTSRARTRSPSYDPATPSGKDADFDLSKEGQREIDGAPNADKAAKSDDVSAADYDPVVDRKRDEERETRRLQNPAVSTSEQGLAEGVGEPATRLTANPLEHAEAESDFEEVEVDDEDDDDDMFAVSSEAKKKKIVRVKKSKTSNGQEVAASQFKDALPSHGGLTDNWDDSEGYYRIVLGEKIGPMGRFHVFANLGKGMFSEVVRAKDLGEDGKGSGDKEVAIKIVRSQETMYKAGLKEIGILKKLSSLDPEDKRHVVRLTSHFEHRGHLCMVFESLSMNLREVVKRFGKDVGLNLRAVRAYAHQMFLSLALMKKAEVMHADIKPDNILVNEAKTMLKICDLGSASDLTEMEITPYLVSRFYRAPEIILGQPYDCSLDMWSIGCTLYELYTGKILFPGRSNNQMLLLMQELKGRLTTRQIKKGKFSSQHFDESNAFLSREMDKNTGSETVRKVVLSTSPNNDLRSRLLSSSVVRGLTEDELRLTQHFVDLLGKTLELDPARRITPNEALKHPFLN